MGARDDLGRLGLANGVGIAGEDLLAIRLEDFDGHTNGALFYRDPGIFARVQRE